MNEEVDPYQILNLLAPWSWTFPTSRSVRNTFLLFISHHSLWCSAIAAWKDCDNPFFCSEVYGFSAMTDYLPLSLPMCQGLPQFLYLCLILSEAGFRNVITEDIVRIAWVFSTPGHSSGLVSCPFVWQEILLFVLVNSFVWDLFLH